MATLSTYFEKAWSEGDLISPHPELRAIRKKARSFLSERGYPSKRNSTDNTWRWSQHLLSKKEVYRYHTPQAPLLPSTAHSPHTLEFQGGVPVRSTSSHRDWSLKPLHEVLKEQPQIWQDFHHPFQNSHTHKPLFYSLALSFLCHAYVLTLHPSLKDPLVLNFLNPLSSGFTSQPFLWIRLEEGCQASLLERHETPHHKHGGGLYHFTLNIDLAPGSSLHHSTFTHPHTEEHHIHSRKVLVRKDSHYHHLSAARGSALSRQDLSVLITESGGEVSLHGVSYHQQHLDHQVEVVHQAPHTRSHQLYKNMVTGKGHGVCRGKIYLERQALSSQADLMHRHLILSPEAKVDAQPDLISDTNEVKASHGATITQIAPEDLHYLRTRGLTHTRSQDLMIRGFLYDIICRWPHNLRDTAFEQSLTSKESSL